MAANDTALAISGRGRPYRVKQPRQIDRVRWYLYRQHVSLEEIAERHGVSVLSVQDSINRMEAHRALTSSEEIDMKMNSIVLRRLERLDKVIAEAQEAEIIITHTDPETGETEVTHRAPDHATRLAANEQVRKIADRNIPKGAGVQVNVQQNAGEQTAHIRGRSFEELLRKAREDAGLTNSENIQDAEYEEVDETRDDDEGDENEDEKSEGDEDTEGNQ